MSEPKLKHANLPENAIDMTEFMNSIAPLADLNNEADILVVADWLDENADEVDALIQKMRASRRKPGSA